MLKPSKFSLDQCEKIDEFVQSQLTDLSISFFACTKAYPNNRRYTLSNDPKYLDLYFELKHYELEWVGYPQALREYGRRVGTWQFCNQSHKSCKIWQEHQKVSNVCLYLWLYFPYKAYASFFVFGISEAFSHILTEAADRELTLLINNPTFLRRFIQNFRCQFADMLEQAEKHKYTVNHVNLSAMEKDYADYWGKYFETIKQFEINNKPEKIYLTGDYHKVFLTRDEAILLYKYYQGAQYRDIAKEYGLSVRTIESRFSEIKYKLQAKTKLELLQILIEHEVLEVIQFSI